MIRVTKYTNIDLSVVGISIEIIKILKEDRLQKYNQILGKVIGKKGKQAQENFSLALSFLFLIRTGTLINLENLGRYCSRCNNFILVCKYLSSKFHIL